MSEKSYIVLFGRGGVTSHLVETLKESEEVTGFLTREKIKSTLISTGSRVYVSSRFFCLVYMNLSKVVRWYTGSNPRLKGSVDGRGSLIKSRNYKCLFIICIRCNRVYN